MNLPIRSSAGVMRIVTLNNENLVSPVFSKLERLRHVVNIVVIDFVLLNSKVLPQHMRGLEFDNEAHSAR